MSHIDALRERRKELAKGRHVDLDIAGYKGMLVGRFVPVAWLDIKKINSKAAGDKRDEAELFQKIDTIVRATERLLFRNPDNGVLVNLDPDNDDHAVGWDLELASILDLPASADDDTRSIMRKVFDNDVAIDGLYNRLGVWMQNTDIQITEDHQGEFEATVS